MSRLRSIFLTGLIEDLYQAYKFLNSLALRARIGFRPVSAFMTFSSSMQQTYMEQACLIEPQALCRAYASWHICSGLSCP
jgi:hypothetical protein